MSSARKDLRKKSVVIPTKPSPIHHQLDRYDHVNMTVEYTGDPITCIYLLEVYQIIDSLFIRSVKGKHSMYI